MLPYTCQCLTRGQVFTASLWGPDTGEPDTGDGIGCGNEPGEADVGLESLLVMLRELGLSLCGAD